MSFCSIITIFVVSIALLGFYLIKNYVMERAQAKVRNDLNSAREIYREGTENIRDVVRFTAVRFFIKDALSANNIELLKSQLEQIRKTESLDILTLTDPTGKVLIRSRNPCICGDSQARDELVDHVLSTGEVVAGTVIVPREELLKEGADLAQRAYAKFVPTHKAKLSVRTEQTSGMMIKAAAPVLGYDGRLIGVLYGGALLNRNYDIVDKVKETVYQGSEYKGRDIGTATIFQRDVRISTNVRREDGSRAIGTRVSEEVYEQVLVQGLPWVDRAFVVTDWYKTAYEPIKDTNGQVIGMLYVGTLEQPFIDMAKNVSLVFVSIVLIATLLAGVLALILAGAISRPLTRMLDATEKLSEGNLGYKVNAETGTAELNMLATSFNDMSTCLGERERSLRISNENLAALNKAYLDLVGFVSHELKGVLASTMANAYSVRDGFCGIINSEQKMALDSITKNLDYLGETLRKFLNLSRIEKGELELNKVDVCLREEVFSPSLEAFSREITEKQMEIINQIKPRMKVKCDRDLLLMVANNLVGNAVKYGFDKGKVVLSCNNGGDKVQIEVYSDSRPIKEQEKVKLFKKFSRLDVPETKQVKGTGLGLFITKEIIEKHGGDIWVEPREHGNSFIFQMEGGPIARNTDDHLQENTMANKKILWVEDDKEVISAYEPRFKSQGWQVVSACSAEEGRALAQQAKPDLIIMDIIMEGEHGYAAIKDLKSEPALQNVPIVIFSGVTRRWGETTASRLDALLTEADEFVDKSEKPDVLLSTVAKCLHAQVS
jgi:two-component system NtrC family sensor kinase